MGQSPRASRRSWRSQPVDMRVYRFSTRQSRKPGSRYIRSPAAVVVRKRPSRCRVGSAPPARWRRSGLHRCGGRSSGSCMGGSSSAPRGSRNHRGDNVRSGRTVELVVVMPLPSGHLTAAPDRSSGSCCEPRGGVRSLRGSRRPARRPPGQDRVQVQLIPPARTPGTYPS
jgi:hypothetical protein